MKKFNFKGGDSTLTSEILKEVVLGGQKVTITKASYTGRDGQKNHTICLSGVGKETRMGPQKALAIIAAAEEIEQYFRDVGVIE